MMNGMSADPSTIVNISSTGSTTKLSSLLNDPFDALAPAPSTSICESDDVERASLTTAAAAAVSVGQLAGVELFNSDLLLKLASRLLLFKSLSSVRMLFNTDTICLSFSFCAAKYALMSQSKRMKKT